MIIRLDGIEERLIRMLDKLLRCICKGNRTLNEGLSQSVDGEDSVSC